MNRKLVIRLLVSVFLVAMTSLVGQITTALIRGTVTDPSGAAVPSAEVTVTNSNTGYSRTVTANDQGNWTVADLPYGSYEISVSKEGFRRLLRSGVDLSIGDRLSVDLALDLGSVSDTVSVSAETPTLRTEDASLSQVVTNEKVENLPIVGRSFDQLLYVVPGSKVSPTGQYAATSLLTAGPAIGVSFNGMRTEMNDYQVDGTRTTMPTFGTPGFYPSLETLEEFRVETQNTSSELSRVAGGTVLLSTKSGTNAFHGSVYDFLLNDNLDSRNPFALSKAETGSNLFGATVGGPIIRDKTFFFAAYEGFRARVAGTQTGVLADANSRRGIFSDTTLHPNPIIDPQTGEPFPDNIIPESRIDPIAKNVLGLWPDTNTVGFPNYTKNTPTQRTFDQVNVRVDHHFSSFARLFGRYSIQPTELFTPNFTTVDPSSVVARPQNIVVGFDASTALFFNSLRFGHTRFNSDSDNTRPDLSPQQLGFPLDQYQASPKGDFFGIPAFVINNYAPLGATGGTPGRSGSNHYEIGDTMTLVRGNHTFRWGGNYTRTNISQLTANNERGRYAFDGFYTGDPLGDFLLGFPRNLSRTTQTANPLMNENHVYGHFADSWKMRPDLTIDWGLAYSYNGQPYEVSNRVQSFHITTIDGVKRLEFVFGGDPRFPRSLFFANPYNFDPRIGIAWRPFGSEKTVVRIAGGRFHSLLTWNDRFNIAYGPPFQVEEGFQNSDIPTATLARGFLPEFVAGPTATTRGAAAPMDFKDAAVNQWNINIQREIAPGTVAQIGYIGNTAVHLDLLTYFNTTRPGPGDFPSRRPYPLDPGAIFYGETNGTSTYHAFRAQIDKRFSNGWTLLAHYTFAKQLDNATALADGFGGQYFVQDSENIRADKGLSSDNAEQRFVASFVYKIPGFTENRVVNSVLGGWQVSGVTTLMSGLPWSARQPGNRSNRDVGDMRPDRICDGNLSGDERTLDRFFDTGCYALTPLYALGTSARNTLMGPGLVNFDMSLGKEFAVREGKRILLRGEFFNLTNTPYFGKPGNAITSTTFGKVTGLARGASAPVRSIQLALKFTF